MKHYIYYEEKRESGEWFFTHRETCFCPTEGNHWAERPVV